MPEYPRLSSALDAVYLVLWRARGRPVSVEGLYDAYKPGVRHADASTNIRRLMPALRSALKAAGYPDCIVTIKGEGYLLLADRAPAYRHQLDRRVEAHKRITIRPLPPPSFRRITIIPIGDANG
jgi:DNA-binding winged helix-turn-helix (wHTH) protein